MNLNFWLVALSAVGVLALTSVVVSLFFSLGRRPRRYSITQAVSVDSDAFLVGLSGTLNCGISSGGTARLLHNGDEIWPAVFAAIRSATKSVNFMCYIWEPGKLSDQVLEVLSERARAGVEVRVMLDGMGGMWLPNSRLRGLIRAGGRVRWFHRLTLGKLASFHKRNHRRAIVVDGKVAFTGGAAVADVWMGNAEGPNHWRDIMVEVTGQLAASIQSSFTHLWANSTGEILFGDSFYPNDDEERRGQGTSRHIHVPSSPAQASHPLAILFWSSFSCASKSIYVTTPYFAPDASTRKILAHRAQQGVDVRLLLPNRYTDAKIVRWASHVYYGELLRAGARIYEYQPTMIHSKTVVVDDIWSIVGSANIDIRSKELNQESVICMRDSDFGRQLVETFHRDLDEAKEIRLRDWMRRSLGARLLARCCALFVEQL
jgi:cardiolipin synthase A/B